MPTLISLLEPARVVFAAGEVEKTIWVLTSDDTQPEADETFSLELSNVSNAVLGDAVGVATIIDNDSSGALPELSIADMIVNEGSVARVIISLSQPSSNDVSFQILTNDQSATAGLDYSAKSGTRVIAAGENEKTIWIPTAQDTEVEGSETFTLELSNANNAVIIDGNGLITIADDDSSGALPTLNIADSVTTEGRFVRFDLSLTAPAAQAVSFMFNTISGSATEGIDYIQNSGTRTINAGETEKSIWVETIDDTQAEADETFTVEISSVSGATLGDRMATATIINNDMPAGAPNLSIADVTVVEGSLARCILTLSQAFNQDIQFSISTIDGTATANLDFTPKNGGRVFTAGETEKTIWIPIIDDTDTEGTETFSLEIVSANNAVITDSTGDITIIDND